MDFEERPAWQTKANCLGYPTSVFFPERGAVRKTYVFKICNECTVKDDCREQAIENNEQFGIWGGMNERERRREKRRLRTAAV